MNKIIDLNTLIGIKEKHPHSKIVHCHGVFDLLHYGHLRHLKSSKKYGDLLVVTITPDQFVNKGPNRPVFSDRIRAEMLAALEIVDYVAINSTSDAILPISLLKPNIYAKGPDYLTHSSDITGAIREEEFKVKELGGELIITEDETNSSTKLINEHYSTLNNVQKNIVSNIKKRYGVQHVLDIINEISTKKVLVLGEPIIDTYVFCTPQNISTKSPSISANYLFEENYGGGSIAVAKHLGELGCDVTIIAPHGGEHYTKEVFDDLKRFGNIKVTSPFNKSTITPRKTRFVSNETKQRIFELTNISEQEDNLLGDRSKEFIEASLKESKDVDLVIILDFGHGLWNGLTLNLIKDINTFRAVNVQTNSSNYGYNLYHKHINYDYISLDERELRLGLHDRKAPVEKLSIIASKKVANSEISTTIGRNGSIFIDKKLNVHKCPVFYDNPVDTTGAGDAYFAITALLAENRVSPELIPFLGNIYAGLKSQIIGNKLPVKKIDFIRAVKSILT